jgi:hypothetical protein
MKLIFLVIASEDPVHQNDLLTQQNTWARNLPEDSQVIWLRGHQKNTFEIDGTTLMVPCLELYGNILEKTILGVRYINDNMKFDVLIRTNVSTYFNVERTLLELSRKSYSGNFFGGYIDKTKGVYFGDIGKRDYISGTGIFLSRNASEKLATLDFTKFRGTPDDVAISHFLESSGIPKVRMKRNNLGSTHIFIPTYYIRAKSSAVSTLASTRMKLIDKYFGATNPMGRLAAYIQLLAVELDAFLNHPEPKIRYLQRNRVVFQNFLVLKGGRLWRQIIQR